MRKYNNNVFLAIRLLFSEVSGILIYCFPDCQSNNRNKMCLEFFSRYNLKERHPEDFDVKSPRTVLQVEEIVTQAAEHFLDGVGIAVVEGGVGGDTRTDLVEVAITGIALHNLVDVELALGTWTDKGHLATEDVPELRKLVEVVFTKELADLGHAFVLAAGIQGGTCLFGIELHAAELVDVERTTETADALLLENGGTAVFALDSNVAEQKQGGKDNHGDQGSQTVNNTLGVAFETIHSVGDEVVILLNFLKIYHNNEVLFE